MNCKPVGTHVAVGVYSEAETKDTLSLLLWYVFGKRCLAFLTSAVLWMSEVYFLVFFYFFFWLPKFGKGLLQVLSDILFCDVNGHWLASHFEDTGLWYARHFFIYFFKIGIEEPSQFTFFIWSIQYDLLLFVVFVSL
jgi:hypothetical protein